MSNGRERRERSKLWLIEHVVELRRSAAERARRAVWTIVPEQLKERVVSDVLATESSRGDPRVRSLRRRQRSVSPPIRHERKHVVEERDVRDRVDGTVCILEIHEGVDRFVIRHPRLWVADVVELHDVA